MVSPQIRFGRSRRTATVTSGSVRALDWCDSTVCASSCWEHDTDPTQTETDITTVYPARDGSLWIGYGGSGGISRLKNGHVDVYRPTDGVRQGYVHSIVEDADGVIWAGTRGGLSRFKGNRWERVGAQYGLTDEYVLSVYEDQPHNLWIGTAGGVFVRKAGTHAFTRVARGTIGRGGSRLQ